MPKLVDLTGQRFGRLLVLRRAENIGRQTAWLCKCDCGNEKAVPYWNLVSGQTKSCGCLVKEVSAKNAKCTHKQSYSRLYTIWIGMKQRCYYENHKHFKHYGGRGITVCDEWKDDFQAFHDWSISHGYEDNLTIDRIDVNGNYEPSNCKWASTKVQGNNKRSNHTLELNGEIHTVSEWSKITGIPNSTIHNRLKAGWTIEKALTTKRS